MALSDYLFKTYPNCVFTLSGNDVSSLTWKETNPLPKPSEEELNANLDYADSVTTEEQRAIFEALFQQTAYKQQRANEYPPITDYIDGVVKGDQAQIDAYIAACQAVKAKYPKPA